MKYSLIVALFLGSTSAIKLRWANGLGEDEEVDQ